jgi:origin recognition complex subunit 3
VVKKETDEVRRLLDSDEFLYLKFFLEHTSGQIAFNHLSCAAHIISQIRTSLQTTPSIPFSELWIRAASAELLSSPLLRETMLLVKKTSSDRLTGLLKAVEESLWKYDDFDFRKKTEQFQKELEKLISSNPDPSTPLRSQHDVGTSNLRTTVVAQKVLLSKHKAALSEQDKAYSDLVSRFHAELEAYFERALIDPKELPFIELLMYDLTSPHTEVFQPKPRFAIERALSAPHDYLGCECCGDDGEEAGEGGLSSTQPATAILYQLYLESGALINVSDLWEAFNAMVGEEDEESRTRTM